MDAAPETLILCAMCQSLMDPVSHYVVMIEVLANPEVPPVSREEIESTDYQAQMRELIEQMSDRSPAELQDGVYRRFVFAICARCHARYLENPLPPG